MKYIHTEQQVEAASKCKSNIQRRAAAYKADTSSAYLSEMSLGNQKHGEHMVNTCFFVGRSKKSRNGANNSCIKLNIQLLNFLIPYPVGSNKQAITNMIILDLQKFKTDEVTSCGYL